MKIKVFKFQISNLLVTLNEENKSLPDNDPFIINLKDKICAEKYIELTVNNFCKDKEIIDIKINNIEINNCIYLIYNILYNKTIKL